MPALLIRPLAPPDREAWAPLWADYLTFYEKALTQEVTEATWQRLIDGRLIGRCAIDGASRMLGIAHALLHEGTWSQKPVCYLEDLFVSEASRGQGVGRALIAALAEEGRATGWLRLYWQTAAGNKTARALYDKLARRTDWVRYDLDL